jgi:hypothetical protein
MIHLNLVGKECFLLHLFKCAPNPKQLYHQSITHKINMKLLSFKMVMAPIIHKIHVIFSKCDHVIENIQIHFYFISWFEILYKCEK